jgi:hypothetical protein
MNRGTCYNADRRQKYKRFRHALNIKYGFHSHPVIWNGRKQSEDFKTRRKMSTRIVTISEYADHFSKLQGLSGTETGTTVK